MYFPFWSSLKRWSHFNNRPLEYVPQKKYVDYRKRLGDQDLIQLPWSLYKKGRKERVANQVNKLNESTLSSQSHWTIFFSFVCSSSFRARFSGDEVFGRNVHCPLNCQSNRWSLYFMPFYTKIDTWYLIVVVIDEQSKLTQIDFSSRFRFGMADK